MKKMVPSILLTFCMLSFLNVSYAKGKPQSQERQEQDTWVKSEYSHQRTEKQIRVALASKGFAWLSGSPADNQILSVGKNAQFFGFVALRYQSGRAANRGALGRAFFSITDSKQRNILANAVIAEEASLEKWWSERDVILSLLENYLYTGEPVDSEIAAVIGAELSKLNAMVAIHEARAFASLEDSLSNKQQALLAAWRENPEKSQNYVQKTGVNAEGFTQEDLKKLEDLYAKAFSWITGTMADNEVIPLGQPAQYFGFVSIRHKSGHGASRGKIAKSFLAILDSKQLAIIDAATKAHIPLVQEFLKERRKFLDMLALLRVRPSAFDQSKAMALAASMGALEAKVALLEAQTYRGIREIMTEDQLAKMMQLRANYIVDPTQIESLSTGERGAQLAILCTGCHGELGRQRSKRLAPTLIGIVNRPIAAVEDFDYSEALKKRRPSGLWSVEALDQFLTSPKTFAPGTKMEFQGLLNKDDRKALLHYLETRY